jgi:hypothetical protein
MYPAKSFWDSGQRFGSAINGVVVQMQHGVRRERTALDSSRTSASERLVTLHSLLKLFNAARPQ